MTRRTIAIAVVVGALAANVVAQQNHIDVVTPSAPDLASYGKYDIGVRTLQATDKNRPDILNTKEGGPVVRYDRTLTLEVWYPAKLAAGQKAGGEYRRPLLLRSCARTTAAPLTDCPAPADIPGCRRAGIDGQWWRDACCSSRRLLC